MKTFVVEISHHAIVLFVTRIHEPLAHRSYNFIHFRVMDVAPEELSQLQSSREDELSRMQLVSSLNSTAALQVELDETKSAKKELEEIVRGLRKELAENKQEGRGSKNERKKKEGRGRGLKTEPRKK